MQYNAMHTKTAHAILVPHCVPYKCGGLRYCTLHRSRSPYPQYMLVAWAGYARNAMLWPCVHTRHARGDDMKARVFIVYIRRQGHRV